MKAVATKHDGSRPVSHRARRERSEQAGSRCATLPGYNYMDPQAEEFHKAHPDKPVMGTENGQRRRHARHLRHRSRRRVLSSSYDPYTTTGRASAEGWWRFCNARPWLPGGFVWTGFDYRGEPSPYRWPNISSQYGIIDTCGFPEGLVLLLPVVVDEQAGAAPLSSLELARHGRQRDRGLGLLPISTRWSCSINGQSLGAKDVKKDSHVAWIVKYAPGSIEAAAFKDGKQVLSTTRETTGPASKLVLRADRSDISADGEDVAMFAVEVQDAQGRTVP